jgi:hypothetical protein
MSFHQRTSSALRRETFAGRARNVLALGSPPFRNTCAFRGMASSRAAPHPAPAGREPRMAMASVRSPILPVDRLPVMAAIAPHGWVRRLPRGLLLATASVLIPGYATRWL